jgi:hypothetical protein
MCVSPTAFTRCRATKHFKCSTVLIDPTKVVTMCVIRAVTDNRWSVHTYHVRTQMLVDSVHGVLHLLNSSQSYEDRHRVRGMSGVYIATDAKPEQRSQVRVHAYILLIH